MVSFFSRTLVALACAVSGASCLPADTRPVPATVMLSVRADEASPLLTVDGWTVDIDRMVVGVGNASFDDACIQYSEGRYDRLLDARLPSEQKLSVLYGLGRCPLRFRVSGPSIDTLLGSGVTGVDKLAMGTPAPDLYGTAPERTSFDVRASASRGEQTARVRFSFRQVVRYRDCGTVGDPLQPREPLPIEFASGASLAFQLVFDGAKLLRDDAQGGELRFDPIEAADSVFGDADGEITLDELAKVPLAYARMAGPYALPTTGVDGGAPETDDDAGPGRMVSSLGDYVTSVLMPRVPHFRESIGCTPLPMARADR